MSDSLLNQAVTIRDENQDSQNTALRIGKLFVDIVNALGQTLAAENISVKSTSMGVSLVFSAEDSSVLSEISIPVVSDTTAGVISPARLSALKTELTTLVTTERNARVTAVDNLNSTLSTVNRSLDTVRSTANAAIPLSQKGKADGVVPLDATGKIPSSYMPSYVDDVVEFDFVTEEGLTCTVHPNDNVGQFSSSDEGCTVVYSSKNMQFYLVRTYQSGGNSVYEAYGTWLDSGRFQRTFESSGYFFSAPLTGKIFLDKLTNKGYRWSGSKLVVIDGGLALGTTTNSAFPGNRGAALEESMQHVEEELNNIPRFSNGKISLNDQELELKTVQIPDLDNIKSKGYYYVTDGAKTSIVLVADDELDGIRVFQLMITSDGGDEEIYLKYRLYHGDAWSAWKQTGGAASVGNIYNVTVMKPIDGYYTFIDTVNTKLSAVHAAFNEKKAVLGLVLSFQAGARKWKTYQYVGTSLELDAWTNESNWVDFGSLPAGSENYIIIDNLCGPYQDGYYTLGRAVQALMDYQRANNIVYAKRGLVISYLVGENMMETKQFQGAVADFNEDALWTDFGGGGSDVELGDAPAANGQQALSTGGAYNHIPANLAIQYDENEGKAYIQMLNAAGNAIGDRADIPIGGGSGDSGGTIISIAFKDSPLYGAFGGTIATAAAIRSVTMSGKEQQENSIQKIEIVDRDSGLTVYSETLNRASSKDLSDFSFPLDFTSFFSAAGARRFKLVITDDTDYTTSRNIPVTAVDVTCTCVQVLQYSPDSPIRPTSESVSIPMYKFGNNQSDKGIIARAHIKIDGEWQLLQEALVMDSYSHSITLKPAALGLKHGSYPIKIQGEDVASGTLGNTIYTAVMVVELDNNTPVVALRYNDLYEGNIALYETVTLDVAAYTPGQSQSHVNVLVNGKRISQLNALSTTTYQFSQQIKGYTKGDAIVYQLETGGSVSDKVTLTVNGSAIDAEQTPGTIYDYDFTTRSNADADKSIISNGYEIKLEGANYTTNGFGKYLDKNCLRVAEKVKGSLDHHMFALSSLEATGGAIQFTWASNNIKDKKAHLIDCYDPATGAGFYVTGNKVGIACKNGIRAKEERSYEPKTEHTAAIVVEPASIFVERGGIRYSRINLYLDGENVATIGYTPGSGNLFSERGITFDGTLGDLYLFNLCAWNTYFEWAQAHKNHLVRMTDTDLMVKEFDFNNVLRSQHAEGITMVRPSAAELYARGICYCVEIASEDSFNTFDGGTDTSEDFTIDLAYYDPIRPWRSFLARKVRKRRQGTTSAKRPKKNPRYYLDKATEIVPLFPNYTNEDALLTYALFAKKKVRVGANTIPVDVITVKIDFSDSSGVNDCGTCDMMNHTYRALGDSYLTPAQRFFDGTWTLDDIHIEGLEMNHSTANHPIAVYRSTSDTMQNVYFECRGNWKEDKGEQTALGFMNTPGYNLGCINYQDEDFEEFYGQPGETLDDVEARFRATEGLDTDGLYLLSLYCGRNYRFMRYVDGAWKNTTGSMYQRGGKGGKWVVEGDVLNPVEGFELLVYQGQCWFRGVSSADDLMAPSTMKSSWVEKLIKKGKVSGDTFPAWTYYFESMVDNDDLAIAYATGKKVPYQLLDMLVFADSCDSTKNSDWASNWKNGLRKHANPFSVMSYYSFTDYGCGKDQQSKNMQPMWFLEDGATVINGVYSENSLIMFLNKIYDADGVNDKDNDGGCDTDPEVDPGKPSTDDYTNPFAGWNSTLWVCCREQQEVVVSDDGTTTDLRTVVAAMRNCQIEVDDQGVINPFSPEGAIYFYCTKRQLVWPKVVSSYDGYRKYVQYTATSDSIYFYALQGLGLTSLPAFIRTRWRIRDGYYQTGDFFSGVLSGRIACAADAKITITAAATGYFGVGNDASGSLSESCYLEAGQSYTFTNFAKDEGALLYIYQADRMSAIDLSDLTLSDNFDFSVMTLVETIKTGGEGHVERSMGFNKLAAYTLGDLPFLVTLDIRKTGAKRLDASKCPRIEHIWAQDSSLESIVLAETSPINDIALPSTMTELRFIGLPRLTYNGLAAVAGLQMEDLPSVNRLRIENSPMLDAVRMIADIVASQEETHALAMLRISNQSVRGDGAELLAVIDRGVEGMDANGNKTEKPVIEGNYQLTQIREAYEIEYIEAAIEGITVTVALDAFVRLINEMNGEAYSGDEEVDEVTLENIDDHIYFYNGETYDDYLAAYAAANSDISNL